MTYGRYWWTQMVVVAMALPLAVGVGGCCCALFEIGCPEEPEEVYYPAARPEAPRVPRPVEVPVDYIEWTEFSSFSVETVCTDMAQSRGNVLLNARIIDSSTCENDSGFRSTIAIKNSVKINICALPEFDNDWVLIELTISNSNDHIMFFGGTKMLLVFDADHFIVADSSGSILPVGWSRGEIAIPHPAVVPPDKLHVEVRQLESVEPILETLGRGNTWEEAAMVLPHTSRKYLVPFRLPREALMEPGKLSFKIGLYDLVVTTAESGASRLKTYFEMPCSATVVQVKRLAGETKQRKAPTVAPQRLLGAGPGPVSEGSVAAARTGCVFDGSPDSVADCMVTLRGSQGRRVRLVTRTGETLTGVVQGLWGTQLRIMDESGAKRDYQITDLQSVVFQ